MAWSYGESDYNEWFKPEAPPRAGQTQVRPVPPPPPQAPNEVIGLTPGFTPNYKALIESNPAYLTYKSNATLDVNQAASRRQAALRALALRYGGLPGSFKDAYGDIDAATLEQAKGNEFSDTARIARNYQQGIDALKRGLAGRGMFGSGELTYGLEQADYARGASEFDIGQEFTSAAQMALNDYLGVESQFRRGEADAIRQAEQDVYANPANRPTEGTEARLVPDWNTKYGQPVWQAGDGKLYILGPDGNPVPYVPASLQGQNEWEDILSRSRTNVGPTAVAA